MKTLPLFSQEPVRWTLRDVADAVKAGGIDALDQARLRADAARYQEVVCRTALNAVKGMPFKWTLNPYRGCTHGCHYCFARRYHTQFEMGAGDDFASVILVKTNLAGVLARELARPSWRREQVALGTATDPYQPIEGHYRLTRRALTALARHRTPVGLVTKGPLVVRDVDIIQDVSRAARCAVYLSVPSVDEQAWRRLEPGTAHPLQRLRAARQLADAGIRCGILMAPIVPGITSTRRSIEATLRAIAEHGVAFAGSMLLHLESGTREHFLGFLSREYPELLHGYQRLYAGGAKYASEGYVKAVQDRISGIRAAMVPA